MASQQAIFAETIAAMKKALKRKAYGLGPSTSASEYQLTADYLADSDSDSSIDQLTNRGNKLRKKARFVHEGQLAPPTGPQVYRRTIEHAGYQRDIISRNPPLVDEDGYEVDSDDDDERAQAAMASAAQFDPYAEVKIEHLLAPLTAASDLPDHPTLSKPFTSKTLTQLTQNARDMMQKEKASLWKLKHLLTRMSGDNTWIPCESVETDHDFALIFDGRERSRGNVVEKVIVTDEVDQVSTGTLASEEAQGLLMGAESHSPSSILDAVKRLIDKADANGNAIITSASDGGTTGHENDGSTSSNPLNGNGSFDGRQGGVEEPMDIDDIAKSLPENNGEIQAPIVDEPDLELTGIDQEDIPIPRRMRTRAQAQADSENATSRTRSITPDSINESYIHPFFLAAPSSRPDRNVGLPPNEAGETRRVLQLYIQKQEEICRGVEKLYYGLLKADRLRKLVLKWTKAEAHVGLNRDMSDGEDWYDKEEWGLDEDLKKGQDEEEEDAATTAKKTRTRRQ